MTTEIMHTPTPEFRDYLEGEITREYRRHRSFARLRIAAIFLAALAAGTTAGLASAQIRENAQRDSLLETALSDLSLAGLRLELARARVSDVQDKFKVGVVSQASLSTAESELRQIEAQAARAKLNVDEIRAASLPPRDDLVAPLVGSRDFVIERLQLDLFAADQQLRTAEQAKARMESLWRVGAVAESALLDAELDVTRARAALGVLAERRKLRKEFVDKGTSGEELNQRFQQAQVRFDAMVAQESLNVLRRRLKTLLDQHPVGTAGELDLLRAQLDLRETVAELQLLVRKLKEMKKPE